MDSHSSSPFHPSSTPRSRVQCLGSDVNRCGYCRSRTTSRNFGVWAHHLDVNDYQHMIDAGWRRSGKYLYRPDLALTCCPTYVIRLDAFQFQPSSTHVRVLKRLRNFCQSSTRNTNSIEKHEQNNQSKLSNPSNQLVQQQNQVILKAVHTALQKLPSLNGELLKIDLRICNDAKSRVKVFTPKIYRKSLNSSSTNNSSTDDTTDDTPDKDIKQLSDTKSSQPIQRRRSASTMSIETETTLTRDPQFVSNVAMVLVATQRATQRVTTNSINTNKTKKGKLSRDVQIRFQMQVAEALLPLLQQLLDGIATITISSPGFINFWLNDTDEKDDDATEMSEDKIEGIEVEHVCATEIVRAGNVPDVSWQDKTKLQQKQNIASALRVALKERPGMHHLEQITKSPCSPRTVHTGKEQEGKTTARRKRTYKGGLPPYRTNSEENARINHSQTSTDKEFTMELVPSRFTREAYEVYKKYQMTIHREKSSQCSEDTYRRFLVDSPLVPLQVSDDESVSYGSFHMLYRISGRLFAVGVVDVLPKCLSSVYLFYDPEYAKLSPGTLSALKEIEWIREKATGFPSMQFYYMGYYIHTCPKMRYKANFMPSEILCDETKTWILASVARQKLDETNGRGLRLASPDTELAPEAYEFAMTDEEVNICAQDSKIEVILGSDDTRILSLRRLNAICGSINSHLDPIREKLRAFIRLVGKTSSKYFVHVV